MKKNVTKFLLITLLFMSIMDVYAQTTHRVKQGASGAKNGTSWVDAFDNLQSALSVAVPGDKIYVAQGIYKPSTIFNPSNLAGSVVGATSADNRYNAFKLLTNVTVLGGYKGDTDTNRDVKINETILSGDIGTVGVDTDNSFNVVVVPSGATGVVLDGFTITKGYGNGDQPRGSGASTQPTYFGAGILLRNAAGVFSNLVIKNNTIETNGRDSYGAGFFLSSNSPNTVQLYDITFLENKVISNGHQASGGGLYMQGTGGKTLDRLQFIRNEADWMGGGFGGSQSTITYTLSNSVFFNNIAKRDGGAMFISNGGNNNNVVTSTIVNSTFYGNISTASAASPTTGGLYVTGATSVTVNVKNSIFYENKHNGVSSDIFHGAGANLTIANSITQTYGTNGTNGVKVGSVPQFKSITYGDAGFLKLLPHVDNPAINAGDNSAVPASVTTDLTGTALRINGIVDMGAYENYETLPIELASFDAKANSNSVNVNWRTFSESDNAFFILERSADGVTFKELTKVYSKGNGGANYNYKDLSPSLGVNYYKLTQVDKDGTRVSYAPVAVNFSLATSTEVKAVPNPVTGSTVTLLLAGQNFETLKVVNMYGQQLLTETLQKGQVEAKVDLSKLTKGIYLIVLNGAQGKVVKKIEKL